MLYEYRLDIFEYLFMNRSSLFSSLVQFSIDMFDQILGGITEKFGIHNLIPKLFRSCHNFLNSNQYIAPYVLSLDIHVIVVGKTKERRKGKKEISTKLSRSLIPFNRSKRNALMDDRMLTIEKSCALIFYFQRKQSKKESKERFEDKSPSKEKFDLIKNKY